MSAAVAAIVVFVATAAGAPAGEKHPGAIVGIRSTHCETWSFHRVGDAKMAYAAVARKRLYAYRRPGRIKLRRFDLHNQNGFATVFGIRGAIVDKHCGPLWYRVQLPLKPNGIRGYVRASAVEVGRVRTRIVVDLSERRLTYLRNGRPRVRAAVAIGSPSTPTPTGRYYVNQRLVPDDTSGPFGPGALGISAFSNVLTGWTQGGPIAIHGTNAPWSIGHAVSNGCIRVRNDILRHLFARTPAGTPVTIHG